MAIGVCLKNGEAEVRQLAGPCGDTYVFYFGVGSMCRNDGRKGISYVCAYALFYAFPTAQY